MFPLAKIDAVGDCDDLKFGSVTGGLMVTHVVPQPLWFIAATLTYSMVPCALPGTKKSVPPAFLEQFGAGSSHTYISPVAGHPSEASSFCDRIITVPTETPVTLLSVI